MLSVRKCPNNKRIDYGPGLFNRTPSRRFIRGVHFGRYSLLFWVCLTTSFAFAAASNGLPESRLFQVKHDSSATSELAGKDEGHQNTFARSSGSHHVDLTEQRIVSRLTSQEMDEKYWLDSSALPPQKLHDLFVNQDDVKGGNPVIPDGTRIITIPMSAVPPRLQSPGSSRGMPPTIRIVEIDHSQRTFFQKVFRRALHSETAPKAKIFSVDLHGGIIGVGEYYSVIELGNKRIRVQVDTGSSTLAGLLATRLLETQHLLSKSY